MSVGDCRGARRRMRLRYGIARRKHMSIVEAIERDRAIAERQRAAATKKKK